VAHRSISEVGSVLGVQVGRECVVVAVEVDDAAVDAQTGMAGAPEACCCSGATAGSAAAGVVVPREYGEGRRVGGEVDDTEGGQRRLAVWSP